MSSEPANSISTGKSKRSYTKKDEDFEVVAVRRKVKTYRLQESELDHISDRNSTSEWFGKATVSLASLAIGLGFDWLIQGKVDEAAAISLKIVISVLLVGTVFCGFKWWSTHEQVSDFKKQFTPAEDADLG